ncbi:AAEL011757-PA [Aedes aegypti]|uniref:AAEL011757-PA n=1 Tax=Aedes aegypti TaxID=7159 RepID=Q16P58_AEDAE|nr:AAEL011757-PA [Aedes aegypti]
MYFYSFFRLRRSSHAPSTSNQEPLIVVEESENCEKEEEISHTSSPRQSLDIDSPENPYLLSPWRDPRETRKHSLPTPPCTSGITASQVRRLSERGGEGSGPSPREQAFLATLYSSPAPQPGGRRHSVVTISKVPPTLFGRNRRESIAALPAGQRSAASSRRESKTGPPPSTDHRGSIHNLQLDIMDDIVQARKARMKLWNTSNEKVCEVQTLDEAGAGSSSPMRYTNRRYSDFVGTTLPPIQSFRRASEMPISPSAPLTPATASSSKQISASPKTTISGIVCTNTDLISLLSSLASSATEINRCGDKDYPTPQTPQSSSSFKSITKIPPEASGSNLKKNRSNSFDISLYHNIKQLATGSSSSATEQEKSSVEPGWFAKRHQPMARRKSMKSPNATVSFAKEAIDKLRDKSDSKTGDSTKPKAKESRSPLSKLKWDGRSAIVDARMIGHAIENFITGSGSSKKSSSSKDSSAKSKKASSSSSWFGKADDDDSNDTCDSSLCSTLKDLFVK